MRKKACICITACVVPLGLLIQQASAQFVVTDPALQGTALLMRAQQILQYIKEAQTALNAIQMAQMMVREGVALARHPSTNIAYDLGMLSSVLVQSQGLAGSMAQMDAQFRQIYGAPAALASYSAEYNKWATMTLNTIHGSVNAAGYQGNMLANEQLWMAQIQAMSQTPLGRDQSLQLGNTIATEEVAQLQKLRQLMIADMSAKGAFSAQQINTQQAQTAAQQNSFAHTSWTADTRTW